MSRKRHIRAAAAALRGQQYDTARAHLERALALGDSARVRTRLATVHEEQGRPELAIEQLRRAAELEPDIAWFPDKRGQLYLKLGRTEEACQAFRRALEIKPGYGPARGRLRKHCR